MIAFLSKLIWRGVGAISLWSLFRRKGLRAVVIPARYGSTRFPGKPLVKIAGVPLVVRVYRQAAKSELAEEVVVATDDERIRECVEGYGGRAVMTPECPTGSDRVAYVARSAGESWRFVVNLQGDEPLVPPEDIDRVFHALEETPDAIVTLATEVEGNEELNNPNVVKVVMDCKGYALYFSRSPIPFMRKPTVAYRHVGIYGYSKDVLLKFVSLPRGRLEVAESLEQLRALEHGIPIRVLITDYKGIGVDVPEDVERIEKLIKG